MNSRWWDLRLRFQGLIPPLSRSNSDFDAGAKYHIISDQDYIKYFVATILQFQIYAELCLAANHVGPLHTCDFYRSREAGRVLRYVKEKRAVYTLYRVCYARHSLIDKKCSFRCWENIFDPHFSDFMQKGASLPASQLLKVITRGRTSRLSAEPLLDFFRPLDAWLELQNRDEAVCNSMRHLFEINDKILILDYRLE